jgi:hypothetical protein
MGMDAGVTVTFFNAERVQLRKEYIDCYKASNNCEEFTLRENEKTFRVCFSTEYDDEKCEYCHSKDENFEEEEENE